MITAATRVVGAMSDLLVEDEAWIAANLALCGSVKPRSSCVPFIPFMRAGHDWKHIGDPVELDGGACCSNGLRYECQGCGKVKDRWH